MSHKLLLLPDWLTELLVSLHRYMLSSHIVHMLLYLGSLLLLLQLQLVHVLICLLHLYRLILLPVATAGLLKCSQLVLWYLAVCHVDFSLSML